MRRFLLLVVCVACTGLVFSQNNVENKFRMPLKEVFDSLESRYNVDLRYADQLVEGRTVEYALYRFEPDFLMTFENILGTQGLLYTVDDGIYRIKAFDYPRKTYEIGKMRLDYLRETYKTLEQWEARKAELKACIYNALNVDPLRTRMTLNITLTPKRKMNGYTVENFALETIPGMYVTGSIYRPARAKGKLPLIINPNGHFGKGRYRADMQYRCATFARMGAVAVSLDLFAWGESLLQFEEEDHRRSVAMTMQSLNIIALLDYFTKQKDIDASRIGITGGSGGGSQTTLSTAIDDRIAVSAPVASMCSYFFGGCPCESGLPVHLCGQGTNNAEIAAMAAPRPQLFVTDGGDWTITVPQLEFPFVQRTYGFYGKENDVYNAHFPQLGHEYSYLMRDAVYEFMAKYLGLNIGAVRGADGKADESPVTIEEEKAMYVFGDNGEKLPSGAVKGIDNLLELIASLSAE